MEFQPHGGSDVVLFFFLKEANIFGLICHCSVCRILFLLLAILCGMWES